MHKRIAVAVGAALLLSFGGLGTVNASGKPRAKLLSVTKWQISEPWFGGFSGIEVSDDGSRFIAISDRTRVVEGRFNRMQGELDSISLLRVARLRGAKGEKLSGAKADSEGLAEIGQGKFVVSFEDDDRLEVFSSPEYRGQPLPRSPAFRGMARNGAFEALAVDVEGHLYAMPEAALGRSDRIMVFRLKSGRWTQFTQLPRSEWFQPVGADFGPDGRLYLLERGFNGWSFSSRVRRFDFQDGRFFNEVELMRSGALKHDNLEGLAVWRDSEGRIRLTMVSDDNFRFLQTTEFVEYVVMQSP